MLRDDISVEKLNAWTGESLPRYMGVTITALAEGQLRCELTIKPHHMSPNNYLHAGTIVTLADTAAGYATTAHLPSGDHNFTTIELKSNFLRTALEGKLVAHAQAVHMGRTTHVWDVTVTHGEKTVALFRCTQMVLQPR